MRQSDLVQKIAVKLPHLSANDIQLSVQNILNYFVNTLGEKGRAEIRRFGNLAIQHQAPRIARNPKTGEKFKTPAKNKIRFRMGSELKKRLNPT